MNSYFKKAEFACKCGCRRNEIKQELINKLDKSRDITNTPFIITSGYRCPSHNKSVGGSPSSSHLKGLAVDIKADNSQHRMNIVHGLTSAGFTRIGIHYNFIHADMDTSKPQDLMWVYK
jgi:zinc D-Ala-D-Ala carboxypeptidase